MPKLKTDKPVQEVILPDFPDNDNTVTTVTKSRRVSFGTNIVKEFIVGSAVSAQCIGEYEQAFPSSDSSNADSSHSAAESEILDLSPFLPESHKFQKSTLLTSSQTAEPDLMENRPKPPKFSSTICFSSDSPTADMEFTEGCITLAKSILDKKNKEMTVIIEAKTKQGKDEEKPKEETKYFDASQFEMSFTRCLKSKENKREEKRFECENTNIYSKFEDEMNIVKSNKVFSNYESNSSMEESIENPMALDMILRHLDKDTSDVKDELFSPEKSLSSLLNPFDLSNESEKLSLNESMDISGDFPQNLKPIHEKKLSESEASELNESEKAVSNESMEISNEIQNERSDILPSPDNKISDSNELEKISMDSELVQFNRTQSEKEKADVMETTPFDLSKPVEVLEEKLVDADEGIKEIEEPEEHVFIENGKIMDENERTPEKSVINEFEQSENVHPVSQLMESTTEPLLPAKKTNESQIVQHENVESPSREQKSADFSIPKNPDDVLKLSVPQCDESENLDEPMAVCVEEMKIPEEIEPPTNDLIVNKDGSTLNLEAMEVSLNIQQNVPELPEIPIGDECSNTSKKIRQSLTEPHALQEDSDEIREPSPFEISLVEKLKGQSQESGCIWSLKEYQHPSTNTPGFISFSFELLESAATIQFTLKASKEKHLVSSSIVTCREISLNKGKQLKLPEHELVVGFGFREYQKLFDSCRQVKTISQIPHLLDELNCLLHAVNLLLKQIHYVLTLYPGSRLNGNVLSFRLYSFPISFSCIVSIDLTYMFTLSKDCLSFEYHFGHLNENEIRNIFQECLKRENSLIEFIIQATKYLIELEKKTGFVSKRSHIRLLPADMKL